jgi:cell division protein ZapA
MSEPVPIRVRVLDREYPLRVAPGDEDYMQHLAQKVDERLRRIQQLVPTQGELTHAILVALQLAEEVYGARAEADRMRARVELDAAEMSDRLDRALRAE